jgi:hypothetical protein
MPKAEAAEAAIALLNEDSSKRLTITNDDQVEIKTGEYVPRNSKWFNNDQKYLPKLCQLSTNIPLLLLSY